MHIGRHCHVDIISDILYLAFHKRIYNNLSFSMIVKGSLSQQRIGTLAHGTDAFCDCRRYAGNKDVFPYIFDSVNYHLGQLELERTGINIT